MTYYVKLKAKTQLKAKPTTVHKHSVCLHGMETSISLENEFWTMLRAQAAARRLTITQLLEQIARQRAIGTLSSAVRVFCLTQATETDSYG